MSDNFVTDVITDLHHAGFTLGLHRPENGGRYAEFKLSNGRVTIPASWRKGLGFAIYMSNLKHEGVPDEVYMSSELACRRIKQIAEIFDRTGVVGPMTIKQLIELKAPRLQPGLAANILAGESAKTSSHYFDRLAESAWVVGGRPVVHVVTDDMDVQIYLPAIREECPSDRPGNESTF